METAILGPDGEPARPFELPTRRSLTYANQKGIRPSETEIGQCFICNRHSYLVPGVYVGKDKTEKNRACFDCFFLDTHTKKDLPKRNEPCPCGSGLKSKKCCLANKKPKF